MFIVIVDKILFVKKYEQDLFGGGLVYFTNNEKEAAKLPEMVAREIAAGLRELIEDIKIKKI